MMRGYLDRMMRPFRRPRPVAPAGQLRPLTEGYVVKGGHNSFAPQIAERPPAPGAMTPRRTDTEPICKRR